MWDHNRDTRLFKLKAQGLSFAEIGEIMGVTRNAALGRYSRLSGKIFPSEVARKQEAREASEARQADIRSRKEVQLSSIKQDISRGLPRLKIIKSALKAGATYQTIADAFGCTKQNIHQMVS